jgi:hypothetical protein
MPYFALIFFIALFLLVALFLLALSRWWSPPAVKRDPPRPDIRLPLHSYRPLFFVLIGETVLLLFCAWAGRYRVCLGGCLWLYCEWWDARVRCFLLASSWSRPSPFGASWAYSFYLLPFYTAWPVCVWCSVSSGDRRRQGDRSQKMRWVEAMLLMPLLLCAFALGF